MLKRIVSCLAATVAFGLLTNTMASAATAAEQTGQVYLRSTFGTGSAASLMVSGKADILAGSKCGTMSLQGSGWTYSGIVFDGNIADLIVKSACAGSCATVTSYGKCGTVVVIVDTFYSVPTVGKPTVSFKMYKYSATSPGYRGALYKSTTTTLSLITGYEYIFRYSAP